jgi:DNA-binding MarR family transcriptional regulator
MNTRVPPDPEPSAAGPWQDLPLQEFLTYRLARLNATLNRQATAILQAQGPLRLAEWRVLALLAAHGEINGRRLTEIAGIDPGLASRTLAALQERRLIDVRRDPGDRRSVKAGLTAEGSLIHARLLPLMRARQQRLMASLAPADREAVFRIVDTLMAAAEPDVAVAE